MHRITGVILNLCFCLPVFRRICVLFIQTNEQNIRRKAYSASLDTGARNSLAIVSPISNNGGTIKEAARRLEVC